MKEVLSTASQTPMKRTAEPVIWKEVQEQRGEKEEKSSLMEKEVIKHLSKTDQPSHVDICTTYGQVYKGLIAVS